MSDPLQEMYATARAFIRDAEWVYAKTMPTNPHWYVTWRTPDPRLDALLTLVHQRGIYRRWHGTPYLMLSLDGWDYWNAEPVLNRKPTQYAGWDYDPRPPKDWLPESYRRNIRGDEVVL